jgi:hypothetical protein
MVNPDGVVAGNSRCNLAGILIKFYHVNISKYNLNLYESISIIYENKS